MREEKVGLHTIKFYDSPENLPIKRFQKFNKYLMIATEVGDTFEDFIKRDAKLMEYMRKEMYKEAIIEIGNRTQTAYNAYTEYSPKEMALAIMVYSIDGNVYKDHSSGTLTEIINRLDEIGYTKKAMDQLVSEVKKKSKWSWNYIFRRNSEKHQTRK